MEGKIKIKTIHKILIFLFIFFGSFTAAHAADFNLLPLAGTLGLNQEIEVDLRINSQGVSINAAQATIVFPSNIIQVKSISKSESVFSFWLQEPTFDNSAGTISFIGGAPNGIGGSALEALSITFVTKGVGTAAISFTDGAITAADGTGTNIISVLNGATFVVSAAVVAPPPPEPGAPPTEKIIPPIVRPTPVPIIRRAVQAVGLPEAPRVSISLYPDKTKWYSIVAPFTASWQLLPDISSVATALNKNPNFVPTQSEGLFDSEKFPSLEDDGVFYLHVRFRNNRGWGPTTHYKIAVDNDPPLPFTIQVQGGVVSDDPTPTLLFQTGDTLSGIDIYLIQINQEEPIIISPIAEPKEVEEELNMVEIIREGISFLNVRAGPSTSEDLVTKVYPGEAFEYTTVENNWYKIELEDGTEGWVFGEYVTEISEGMTLTSAAFISEYDLPPLEPGGYLISVRAVDQASNSIEDSIELEILPIEPPIINFYTKRILQKIETLNIRGSAIPNATVIVTMLDEDNVLVLENEIPVNDQGNWSFILERTLRKETYTISVKTRDDRGAISLPADSVKIKVTEKPILVIGNIEFSLRDMVIIGIILALIIAGFFWRDAIKRALSLKRRSVIAAKDLRNLVDTLKINVGTLTHEMSKSRMNKVHVVTALNKITKSLGQIDRYVVKDIEEINTK